MDMINFKLSQYVPNNRKGIGYSIKMLNTLQSRFWKNEKNEKYYEIV